MHGTTGIPPQPPSAHCANTDVHDSTAICTEAAMTAAAAAGSGQRTRLRSTRSSSRGDGGGAVGGGADADMRALLLPGGSPSLPLEPDVWAQAIAAARREEGEAEPGDDLRGSSSTGTWWRGAISFGGRCSCSNSGSDDDERPPASRHRACQFGYTDSAPARRTEAAIAAATAATARCDLAVLFLRAPCETAAWQQPVAPTFSAPAAAAAAAAGPAQKPGALVASLSAALNGTAPRPLAALVPARAEPPPLLFEMELSDDDEVGPVRENSGRRCSALAVPATSPPRNGCGFCSSKPASSLQTSRWARAAVAAVPLAAAAAAAPPPPGAPAGFPTAAASQLSGASGGDDPCAGYFGTPLAAGLSYMLNELAEVGDVAAGGGDAPRECGTYGGTLFACGGGSVADRCRGGGGEPAAAARRRCGRTIGGLGWGLLSCFTGHC